MRWIVTGLTGVMLVGVLAILGILVTLVLRPAGSAPPVLPAALTLPPGERAEAATLGRGWVLVVTRDAAGRERLRLFDAQSGRARQVVEVAPGP